MPFEPGHNIGRKAGTTNKITSDIKQVMSKIIQNELAELPNLLGCMTAFQRADILLKLCRYVIPVAPAEPEETPNHAQTISDFINALRSAPPAKEPKVKQSKIKQTEPEQPTAPEQPKPIPEPAQPKPPAELKPIKPELVKATNNVEFYQW